MIKKIKSYLSYLFIFGSIFLCVLSFKIFLVQTANQLEYDFSAQNLTEINSSDIFSVGSKLNALSQTIHWVCIKGQNNNKIFFEKINGYCGKRPWQAVIDIKTRQNSAIVIEMTIRLSKTLEMIFIAFILLQLFLLFGLFLITKKHAEEKLKIKATLGDLATQVAHDIRSPLAALSAVQGDLAPLPEEVRILIRSAMDRIRDIANNLLDKNKELSSQSTHKRVAVPLQTQSLSMLIDKIISEKRAQFQSKEKIGIHWQLNPKNDGIFSKLNPIEFNRVISNLINNSAEAFENNSGKIEINLSESKGHALIEISDTGKGISPELVTKLGQRGLSHGKEKGSGLGLFHAKTTFKAWGGSFSLKSELGKGTAVTLSIPRVAAPAWFLAELKLAPNTEIMILDDDEFIHQVWEKRFQAPELQGFNLKRSHFTSPPEFIKYCNMRKEDSKNRFSLIDYEYVGFAENGLDVIESQGLESQSVLVTNRYDEESVCNRCERLSITILPKPMAGIVPIKMG